MTPGAVPVGALHDLELDRRNATFFLCGPGVGECVVIALPERGWLVIDGAGGGARSPALHILQRYRGADDPIDALLLTHPHRDHFRGFVELLDDDVGAAVQRIGCVAKYVPGRSANTAILELDAAREATDPANPTDLLRAGAVRRVLERIRTEWEERPSRELRLVEGTPIPLSSEGASATVLSPSESDIDTFFNEHLGKGLLERANDISVTIELEIGECRILLGSDLPHTVDKRVVASGWDAVKRRTGDLRMHHVLKTPHHGSVEALPDFLIGRPTSEASRSWAVTPYSSQRLPRFDAEGGVVALLQQESEVHLTALPTSICEQVPLPDSMRRKNLATTPVELWGALGTGMKNLRAAGSNPDVHPRDAIWALVLDRQGRLVRRHRGDAATIVTE